MYYLHFRWMHYGSKAAAVSGEYFHHSECGCTLMIKSVLVWWHKPSHSWWNKQACVKVEGKAASLLECLTAKGPILILFFFLRPDIFLAMQGTHTSVLSLPKGVLLSFPTHFPPSLPLVFQWMKQNMVSHYQPDSSLSLTGGVSPPSLLCGELGSER